VDLAELVTGRVAILGTGREGRAAWRYLRKRFPSQPLLLIDESEPGDGLREQLTAEDSLVVGPLAEAELERFDLLVRSPGISPYRKSIRRAIDAGVAVTSPSSLWFAAHPNANTICVTGTKGKSTTTSLIAHLLGACGLKVRLAGNIGRPLLDCDDRDVDWWVIELSSYQLADLEARPNVGVLLNLSPDHLDWHFGEENYTRDKLRLAGLAAGGKLIANAAEPVLTSALGATPDILWFNSSDGMHVAEDRLMDGGSAMEITLPPGLPGAHNLSNLAAALTVVRAVGANLETALRAVKSFRPLPHRLQVVGQLQGIVYINDSISSTPVATVAALETFAGKKVTLIVGGLDRGVDWAPYMRRIGDHCPLAVIGVPDNGPGILRSLEKAGVAPESGLHLAADLEQALAMARSLTSAGGVVLLSPGAPSFPRYRDYRERGRHFAELCGFGSGADEEIDCQ
jgi:UDP-N-acetylmuramoylalanine--D-glutamate ligase